MQYTSGRVTNVSVRTRDKAVSRNHSRTANIRLFFAAYSKLIRFDRYLARGDFAGLYQLVRMFPLIQTVIEPDAINRICHALDLACVWYWKEVLCLQRSAATTCLLRSCGVPARMALGIQQTPFRAHAWVEANGQVVNDKPYMRDFYRVIDIC